MSNRHRVIGAIEEFRDDNPIPIRSLVFKDSKDGRSTKQQVYFPENRTSLIYNGILYDWYGREIELDDNIKKVISPFGYGIRNMAYETYLVERKDSRLAIAELLNLRPANHMVDENFPEQIQIKDKITGSIMLYGQKLVCKDWYFKSIYDYSKNTCLKAFNYPYDFKVLFDIVYNSDSRDKYPRIYFYSTFEDTFGEIENYVSMDRESILKIPSHDITLENLISRKLQNMAPIASIIGTLNFSKDGNKVSTYMLYFGDDKKPRRISTDVEVLHHTKNAERIIWYHDPE